VNRRTFLGRIIKVFFSSLAGALGFFILVFLYPARIKKKSLRFIQIMNETDLPRRGVKMSILSYRKNDRSLNARVFVVNNGRDLFTLSPVCTHLGCLVSWHRRKNQFLCPCHGGKYDIEGEVVEGPPPAPLTRLPMMIKDEKVFVGLKI
jgi:cytochrome b6-f complex iron-sulfur subunit